MHSFGNYELLRREPPGMERAGGMAKPSKRLRRGTERVSFSFLQTRILSPPFFRIDNLTKYLPLGDQAGPILPLPTPSRAYDACSIIYQLLTLSEGYDGKVKKVSFPVFFFQIKISTTKHFIVRQT